MLCELSMDKPYYSLSYLCPKANNWIRMKHYALLAFLPLIIQSHLPHYLKTQFRKHKQDWDVSKLHYLQPKNSLGHKNHDKQFDYAIIYNPTIIRLLAHLFRKLHALDIHPVSSIDKVYIMVGHYSERHTLMIINKSRQLSLLPTSFKNMESLKKNESCIHGHKHFLYGKN